MMKKESFRRILIRIFWISLVFTIGFSWVYIRYAVPDRLNLVVNEEEVFHFALPPGVTFESDSEEVVLKNASEIPQGMIRIERPDAVSMYGKNEGSYRDERHSGGGGGWILCDPLWNAGGDLFKIKGRYGDRDRADHK